jgi:hypothetical protein
MNNDDLSDRIFLLEAEIDHLVRLAEGYWKIMLENRHRAWRSDAIATVFDQHVFVGSISAILGGIVVAGSNTSTLRQVREICAPPSNSETS